MSHTSHAVELHEVSKLFGGFAALRKIDAEFATGRCHVILGPNGAGKSTLLRVVAGLTRPSFGNLAILGSPDPRAVRGRIGYLGHDSMMYDELTALENLRYHARLYQNGNSGLNWTPEQALQMLGLNAQLNRPVGKFSQGMRQRAALARVLMTGPELMLLDEPFSNVDLASSNRMLRVLASIRDSGSTILLTTHQPELARPLADFFCRMESGRIAGVEDLRSAPALDGAAQ